MKRTDLAFSARAVLVAASLVFMLPATTIAQAPPGPGAPPGGPGSPAVTGDAQGTPVIGGGATIVTNIVGFANVANVGAGNVIGGSTAKQAIGSILAGVVDGPFSSKTTISGSGVVNVGAGNVIGNSTASQTLSTMVEGKVRGQVDLTLAVVGTSTVANVGAGNVIGNSKACQQIGSIGNAC